MRKISILSIFCALALSLYALMMKVTVSTGYSDIVNIHLLSKQQNYLWISGMILTVGLVLFFMSRKKEEVSIKHDGYEQTKNEKSFNYKLYFSNDNIVFDNLKTIILNKYNVEGETRIISDNENSFMLKNDKTSSYIELKKKDTFLSISTYAVDELNFVQDLYKKNISIKDKIEDTNKIIELAKMLEKGLITENEFKEHKKNLINQ